MLASLARILVIFGAACGVAAVYVGFRALPWTPDIEKIETEQSLHAWLRANRGVTLQELLDLIDQGAVVVDARARQAYEQGHLAIDCDVPVLNVPADDIDAHVNRLVQLQGLPIVLYCSSLTCDYAEELYLTLQEYGFVDIWIFFPGWAGIQEAGLPTTSGPDRWAGYDDGPTEANDPRGGVGTFDANTPNEIEP